MVLNTFASIGVVVNHLNMMQTQLDPKHVNFILVDMNLVQNTVYGLNVGLAVEENGKRRAAKSIFIKEFQKSITNNCVWIEVTWRSLDFHHLPVVCYSRMGMVQSVNTIREFYLEIVILVVKLQKEVKDALSLLIKQQSGLMNKPNYISFKNLFGMSLWEITNHQWILRI